MKTPISPWYAPPTTSPLEWAQREMRRIILIQTADHQAKTCWTHEREEESVSFGDCRRALARAFYDMAQAVRDMGVAQPVPFVIPNDGFKDWLNSLHKSGKYAIKKKPSPAPSPKHNSKKQGTLIAWLKEGKAREVEAHDC